jgi:alpha-L-fucosidase 2
MMKFWARLVCAVLAMGSGLARGQGTMAAYNVVWSSPSSGSSGSMPAGNGDIGVNVWCEANGDLIFFLSKTDAWDESGRLLKLGRMRLRMSPNPFASGAAFSQELNLDEGTIEIDAGAAGSAVSIRLWVDAHHPAVSIEAESEVPRDWSLAVEPWRTAPRTITDVNEKHSAWGIINGPDPIVVEPDTVVTGLSDRVVWYHRNARSVWRETLRVQSLEPLTNSLPDPLMHCMFGAMISGAGLVHDTTTRLKSSTATRTFSAAVVALTSMAADVDDWRTALDAHVQGVRAVSPEVRLTAHRDWWRAFWDRHWIHVQAPQGFTLSQGYALQRYMQACSGRGQSPIKFNGSIFTVDMSGFDGDYRKWGPCYWWQNTRLPYWAMLAAGDFDLMEPLFRMYRDALPLARERVQTYYGHAGAYFPETMYFWGTWNNDDYGWNRTGKELGRAEP